MSLDEFALFAEIISALAIVASLTYLAVQVKHARVAASDASRANRRAGIHEINSLTVTNPEFRQAWIKSAGPELTELYTEFIEELNITIEESASLFVVVADWMWLHWAQFRSIKTPEDEAELKNIVSAWYSINPMKTFATNDVFRSFFDSDFIEFMDEAVKSVRK